jgi:hypothetical protein
MVRWCGVKIDAGEERGGGFVLFVSFAAKKKKAVMR